MPTDPDRPRLPPVPPVAPPPGSARVSESATVDQAPQSTTEPAIRFLQSAAGQKTLPLLVAVALHLSLILVVAATYQARPKTYEARQEQLVIPDSAILQGVDATALSNPGLGHDPSRPAAQDQYMDVPADSQGWSDRPSRTLDVNLLENVSHSGGGESLIGLGSGPVRPGVGTGGNSGIDAGGPLAPFGVPGGGQGLGPRSMFMGVAGTAIKIAFVCDASGSMMNKFDALRVELQKAVRGLRPIQQFSIIFFQEESAAVLDDHLLLATESNKARAYAFLNNARAHGSTDVIPALQAAFEQKPELIYLLTDGDFHGRNQQVIEYIRGHNADRKVKINTIAFINNDEEYRKVLQQIAADNGGSFKFVSDQDLR